MPQNVAFHLGLHRFPKNPFRGFTGSLNAVSNVSDKDMCLTADPGVTSSSLAWSHTFVEIDREIISTAMLLPSADSRRVVVSYKRKYKHEVLVNRLVKLAQETVVR